ncbi:MAG: hypothetical protein ACT4OZ_08060 [Gemmatimonadota bacterium]
MRRPTFPIAFLLAATACTDSAAPAAANHVPGRSYLAAGGHIEYLAGNSPVVLSAPRGGTVRPAGIPERTCGVNTSDLNTQDVARSFHVEFHERFGAWPHVIINRLHRDRLDANRDSVEATCGDPVAAAAWREFHRFVELATDAEASRAGKAFYIDLHGHGHAIARLELGYLLSASTLELSDTALDSAVAGSSIRTMATSGPVPPSALVRGPSSLGSIFVGLGYRSVPSGADRSPGGAEYFSGGYNTARHGCRDGGPVCGVQIEAHFGGIRDTPSNRTLFARAIADASAAFLRLNWSLDVATAGR